MKHRWSSTLRRGPAVWIGALLLLTTAFVVWSNRTEAQEAVPPAEPEEVEAAPSAPGPLDSIPVPLPPNLDDFIRDRATAIVLGKALFWDMQAGSDNKVACATCHYHAGADGRTRNTVAPRLAQFRGANTVLTSSDLPFHRLIDPTRTDRNPANVAFDTSEVVGSQGVVKQQFKFSVPIPFIPDDGTRIADTLFNIGGSNTRQVTGRNTPTTINAVYNDRNFWDGRANHFFNGVNPFGDTDPDARVWRYSGGPARKVRILLANASLASQAVGPPLNDVEMSWGGRTFPELGKKLLCVLPLAFQKVDPTDSVLGPYANDYLPPLSSGKGLKKGIGYAHLIAKAFKPEWWNAPGTVDGKHTHMEANFSLYWGLSIMLYESTLVSGDTPFDRYAKGDSSALTEQQKEGLSLFLNEGKCINCHGGPEFTSATVSERRRNAVQGEQLIELMDMAHVRNAFYDGGFYNIGVRPTAEDLGVGADGPFGPLSFTKRRQQGLNVPGTNTVVPPNAPIAVNGAFKTPGLRNVELTGPYMHNGGLRTLEEVVQFYARGTDFENRQDRDPDVGGIPEVNGNPAKIAALVAFMKSLTDDRVKYQKAPFDHPELILPNGHGGPSKTTGIALDKSAVLKETGANGGARLRTFEEILSGSPDQPF